jgi:hypothetical protein
VVGSRPSPFLGLVFGRALAFDENEEFSKLFANLQDFDISHFRAKVVKFAHPVDYFFLG